MDNKQKLEKLIADLDAKIRTLLTSDGPLTDEQKTELAKLKADHADAKSRLKTIKEMDDEAAKDKADAEAESARLEAERIAKERASRTNNRLTQPDAGTPVITVAAQPKDHGEIGRLGFNTLAEFAHEVRQSGVRKAPTERLINVFNNRDYAAVVGMNEGIPSEGGALIPPEFSQKIMERVYSQESLLSRCDQYTINTDSITFPRNAETSRASGSRFGGVRSYWRGEGTAPSTSMPKYGKFVLNLHKLIALAGATSELLKDVNAPVLEQVLFNAFSEEINFEVNAAIVAGTGAGQPSGIKDAACSVSVSKETNQPAATIVPANIVKMWSRMWAGSRRNAVWLINQDTEPQLNLMSFGLGTAGVMMYSPPGGLSSAPYATLMGRPVIPVEQCETLGTKGDIILADLSQYAVATQGGPMTAVSMHLYFDTDQMAFRVSYRIDGAPWWPSALTPYKGSNTQSCFVTLATRA